MNNFDKRFNKASEDFDRDFNRMKIIGIVWAIFLLSLGLGLTGFFIWVIVVLLQFFGVI